MQPNAPNPAPPSEYDFILNHPGTSPKRSILPRGNSKKQRIIIVAVAGAVLLVLIMVAYSLLSGGNKDQTLLEIAQTQTELIRVSTLAAEKTTAPTARALAVNTELTLTTNQKEIVAQLKKRGQKTNTKILGLKKDSSSDASLAQAALDNRYDTAFAQLMQTQLNAYQQLLKKDFDATSSKTLRSILNSEYAQAALLIASAKSL